MHPAFRGNGVCGFPDSGPMSHPVSSTRADPGGNDWVVNREDGVMVIDVRLTLQTDDGALLEPHEYSLAVVAKLECGDSRYSWLNNVIAVGTGEQTAAGPVYSIFEIG